jgi:hypothetical protein
MIERHQNKQSNKVKSILLPQVYSEMREVNLEYGGKAHSIHPDKLLIE